MFLKYIVALVCLIPSFTFANDQVQVSLSSENVNPWQTIVVEILFDPGVSSWEIELSIPGIEKFQVFSQSQQQRVQAINGETQTQFMYQLQIAAEEEGSFIIGPVVVDLWDFELIDDESFTIQVGKPNPPLNSNALQKTPEITETPEPKAQEIVPKPEIKPLRWYTPPTLLLIIGFIIFLITFYWLLRKYFFPYKDPVQREIPKHILDAKRKFELYFQKLEHVHEELSAQEFSRKLQLGIRKIMSLQWVQVAQTGTLREFKKLKDFQEHELSWVFAESYEYEFSSQDLASSKRKEYLEQVIKYVRNIWE